MGALKYATTPNIVTKGQIIYSAIGVYSITKYMGKCWLGSACKTCSHQ